jgi:excisionase family DNA binding protein
MRTDYRKDRSGSESDAFSPIAYSIREVSALTSVSRSLVYENIRSGLLKTIKVGRRTLVLREDVEAWLQSMRVEKQ